MYRFCINFCLVQGSYRIGIYLVSIQKRYRVGRVGYRNRVADFGDNTLAAHFCDCGKCAEANYEKGVINKSGEKCVLEKAAHSY